jgi:hypothetical protein
MVSVTRALAHISVSRSVVGAMGCCCGAVLFMVSVGCVGTGSMLLPDCGGHTSSATQKNWET